MMSNNTECVGILKSSTIFRDLSHQAHDTAIRNFSAPIKNPKPPIKEPNAPDIDFKKEDKKKDDKKKKPVIYTEEESQGPTLNPRDIEQVFLSKWGVKLRGVNSQKDVSKSSVKNLQNETKENASRDGKKFFSTDTTQDPLPSNKTRFTVVSTNDEDITSYPIIRRKKRTGSSKLLYKSEPHEFNEEECEYYIPIEVPDNEVPYAWKDAAYKSKALIKTDHSNLPTKLPDMKSIYIRPEASKTTDTKLR
ncbi:hypothetical protein QAD02_005709 [Eretmocerus hayati]|uniref:Uncharacterized protein n=1 Tax=Eretmocerus hayati TaxID=131215 RepID=A0ACC2NTR0_9HYME|nr:hypothetical protein QAD02_005709 [Eretmocerus hayati]